jgi:large subunit ribosomal protein L22
MSPAAAVDERPGTRAQVRYVRTSPYKVREVLNLIRGEHVLAADEILAFTERGSAPVVRKALRSAVANAENNAGLSADDLVVAACYADEGPTLKRWRPRARGRATRIRKRTCHITIEVKVATPEQLARIRGEGGSARRSAGAAGGQSRRRRVARSRGEDAAEQTEDEATEADAGDGDGAEAKAPATKKATKAKKSAKTPAKKTASDSEKAVKKAAAKKSAARASAAESGSKKKAAPAKKASATTKKATDEGAPEKDPASAAESEEKDS